MVLTAAQTTAFFENDDQMAIPHGTVVQLAQEGIDTVDDLLDFDKDSLKQVADNLRRPGGRIPDPLAGQPNGPPVGATLPTPPFVFGAKSQKRLLVACDLVRFYVTVGRPLTAGNLQWNPVMRNFGEQWKALKDKKEENDPDVPKITKELPIIKWSESFQDHLYRIPGVRYIPLVYVIRAVVAVPAAAPALVVGQPFSTESGSLDAELIARASHAHALYRDDNAALYYKLEEATRSTLYADSIKPFQRAKNGRGAWLALISQYAGEDKWDGEIKKMDLLLHTKKWKGQSNYSLERFVQSHRNAYVSMVACSQHIAYQLPNENSRVGFLLDAIENEDAGLQAAMASIRNDKGVGGMRSNFENAVANLLPSDPVAKRRVAGTKRGAADISDTTAEISSFGTKPAIGKTGVHLRYYKTQEYKALSDDQKMELKEWRANTTKGNNGGSPSKKKTYPNDKKDKKVMAAAIKAQVENQVTERLAKLQIEETAETTMKDFILSVVNSAKIKPVAASASAVQLTAPTLQSILKKAKYSKE
jgi:hypothetical protein